MHPVLLAKIADLPVKGGQWALQPEAHWRAPGYEQSDRHSVVCVSWSDAQAIPPGVRKS